MISELDLLLEVARRLEEAEFARRRRIEIAGRSLWIVSKEDLILSKLDWARQSQSERQLSDVENLLATEADMEYLKTWSQKLNLTDMLTRVSQ